MGTLPGPQNKSGPPKPSGQHSVIVGGRVPFWAMVYVGPAFDSKGVQEDVHFWTIHPPKKSLLLSGRLMIEPTS